MGQVAARGGDATARGAEPHGAPFRDRASYFSCPSSAVKIFHSALGEGLEGSGPISKAEPAHPCARSGRVLPVSYVDPRIHRIGRVWAAVAGRLPREESGSL